MTRDEAMRAIEAAGAEQSEDANDPGWMLVTGEEWGLELRLEESGEQRIRQIAIDSEECHWAGRKIVGVPVHEAVAAIGHDAQGTGWRPEDPVTGAFDDLGPIPTGSWTDEDLLESGTLWVPLRSIGLGMIGGLVGDVVWREPRDIPRHLAGPLTESQRQLSRRPDLRKHLHKRGTEPGGGAASLPKAARAAERLLKLLLVVAFAYLGREAWRESQRWHTAVPVTGQLVQIDKATAKPWVDRYQMKYRDPAGRMQRAVIEAGEFYVAPREVGEEVALSYADGEPPQVRGPAYARDAVFLEYLPKFLGVFVIYLVPSFIVRRCPWTAPPKDDRPNLPQPPGQA